MQVDLDFSNTLQTNEFTSNEPPEPEDSLRNNPWGFWAGSHIAFDTSTLYSSIAQRLTKIKEINKKMKEIHI